MQSDTTTLMAACHIDAGNPRMPELGRTDVCARLRTWLTSQMREMKRKGAISRRTAVDRQLRQATRAAAAAKEHGVSPKHCLCTVMFATRMGPWVASSAHGNGKDPGPDGLKGHPRGGHARMPCPSLYGNWSSHRSFSTVPRIGRRIAEASSAWYRQRPIENSALFKCGRSDTRGARALFSRTAAAPQKLNRLLSGSSQWHRPPPPPPPEEQLGPLGRPHREVVPLAPGGRVRACVAGVGGAGGVRGQRREAQGGAWRALSARICSCWARRVRHHSPPTWFLPRVSVARRGYWGGG